MTAKVCPACGAIYHDWKHDPALALTRAHAEGKAEGRREMAEEIDRLRLYRTDLADELIWIRRGGPMPLAHNHEIEGPGMYVRNAPCPRCEQIKDALARSATQPRPLPAGEERPAAEEVKP